VRLDDKSLTSKARLTLTDQAGQARQWQLVVPTGAEVLPIPADKDRVSRIDTTPQPRAPGSREGKRPAVSLCTLHLKEPSSDPLTVTVTTSLVNPRPAESIPVGPFNVLNAVRQSGSVLLSSSVSAWHLEPTP